MSKTWGSGEAGKFFGVNRETIRLRAIAYADYLSEKAKPGDGRKRRFNEDDMRVLSTINKMLNDGHPEEDIHATLKDGHLTPSAELDAINSSEHETDIIEKLARLDEELTAARTQIQELSVRLQVSEERERAANERIETLLREKWELERRLNKDDT